MTATSYTPTFELLRMEVLGRVTPGLRHQMLGKLQPIALLSQVLSKKLDTGTADETYVKTQVDEIKLNSRLLTTATQNLFSWLAAGDAMQLPADELLHECVDLLKMECYSHQLVIFNHVTSKRMLPVFEARVLLCAAIIVLADIEGKEKILEIRLVDGNVQFIWNEACTSEISSNTGILDSWDWIDAISDKCQITHINSGIQFSFQ
jgi:hypothetical protein